MGFDDFFKHRHHYDDHEYYDRYHGRKHHDFEKVMYFLRKIKNNKMLLFLVTILSLGVVAIGGIALVFIIPFAINAFEFINKEGINGLIESINPFVDRIMNGEPK